MPKYVAALGVICSLLLGPNLRADSSKIEGPTPVPAYPRPGAVKVLENDRVIIWRVTFNKGVPTPLHVHKLDKVTVFMEQTTIADTSTDGKRDVWTVKAGSAYYSKAGTIHIEEGLDDAPREVIVVELK